MSKKHTGRLELTWADKDKTLLSAGDGQYDYTFVEPSDYRVSEVRLLHEVGRTSIPAPECRPEGLPEPTDDNLLITGDAMHVLDALKKIPEYADKYLGKIKLVYIDPPFNTGQAFDHYEDNIEHSIWLTMLRDRLRQIKPLLAPDGSVWVHLDDEEVHRCRVVLDEEMGAENFIAEICWEKADSPNSSATYLSIDQDFILVYANNKKSWRPNRLPRNAAVDAKYTNPDKDSRGRWFGDNFSASKPYSKGTYPITTPSGRVIAGPPAGAYWRYSNEKLKELDEDNRIWWGPNGEDNPKFKRFLDEVGKLVPRTLWTKATIGSNRTAKSEIKALFKGTGTAPFSTPKPERLLQRVIEIGSNPGDIVLDCFGGSGTTSAVAQKMGRRWVISELLPRNVSTYIIPRMLKVIKGEDLGGITASRERVAANGVVLPRGVTPEDAQAFQKTFKKVLGDDEDDELDVDDSHSGDISEEAVEPIEQDPLTIEVNKELGKLIRAASKDGSNPLDDSETRQLLSLLGKISASGLAKLDVTEQVKTTLLKHTRTRIDKTQLWHGGGGFVHLEVGPSMFEEIDGIVLLAEWAISGELAKAMCAQLEVRYSPDGIFAASRGKVRYVIIDGLVGKTTISSILDQLQEGYIVEVWATQYSDDAADMLRKERPGSRLEAVPSSVIDRYRRKAAKGSPFKKENING